MKARYVAFAVLLLLFTGASARATTESQPEKQPVFVFLYARITDHINMGISEDRLRHVLPMLENFRKDHPELRVSATVLLSGAVSEALARRNAQTGIKDFIQDYVRRGVIELGYDGTDEPTYEHRPVADLSKAKTAEDRWLARGTAADRFLTEARQAQTGAEEPGMVGGLKKMQEIFGPAVCVTGLPSELGMDSEVVHYLSRYNNSAIMFGIPETNPAHIPGYRGSVVGFAEDMTPIPESSTELYWQDGVLRSSEIGGPAVRVVIGDEGARAVKDVLSKLNRSRVHIVHVELASERMYVYPGPMYPPLKYAYDHAERPALPATALRDVDEVNASYEKEEGLMKWLVDDFFPGNAGSYFVSSTELKRLTPPSGGYDLSVDELRAAVREFLKAWGNDTNLRDYVRVDSHYLSMADLFQVMTDSLASLNRNGSFPRKVRVVRVFGPIETPNNPGPGSGEVSVASIARICARLADDFHNDSWSPIPHNAIPSLVSVDGLALNSGQFLRLMAEALAAPNTQTKVEVKMTYPLSVPAYQFPKERDSDLGGTWTFKPAPLDLGNRSMSEQRARSASQ